MFGPTVKPRFEGKVQGVVVQAMKKTSPQPSPSVEGVSASNKNCDFEF